MHEPYLRDTIICLKFKFNWVSCILSGNSTKRQMQKGKERGLEPPATGGSHRDYK